MGLGWCQEMNCPKCGDEMIPIEVHDTGWIKDVCLECNLVAPREDRVFVDSYFDYVSNKLLKFSERMKRIAIRRAKLELLSEINAFVEANKKFIYNNCSGALVSIYRSL